MLDVIQRSHLAILLLLPCVLLNTGCSSKPPACSDQAVTQLLGDIMLDSIAHEVESSSQTFGVKQSSIKPMYEVRVEDIRLDGHDESINRIYCAATLYVKPSEPMLKHLKDHDWQQVMLASRKLGTARVDERGIYEPIIYSVQTTKGQSDFYLQIEQGGWDILSASTMLGTITELDATKHKSKQ